MSRFAVDLPVLQRCAEQTHREYGRGDVGQVVDEVDVTRLDSLVETGPDQLVDDGAQRWTAAGDR